jgi:BRCA1-associated protein
VCGQSESLWICLICGHIGCGRYKGGHANNHWQETQHTYALELESQRVWDYAGDKYYAHLSQRGSTSPSVFR